MPCSAEVSFRHHAFCFRFRFTIGVRMGLKLFLMKRAIFGLAVIAMFLTACGDSDGSDDGFDTIGDNGLNMASSTIRLQKLDLSDAKYISLSNTRNRAGGNSETGAGLFKIDENGKVSAIVLSCVESEDGTITQVRTDINVIPRCLISLSGVYTLMLDCSFRTAEGSYFDMLSRYEPDSHSGVFNILVRNSDGKIFYIPQAAGRYFAGPQIRGTASDHRGNLYVLPSGVDLLLTITLQGDDLVIKQVNPNDIQITGGKIWPLENGTVVTVGDGYDYTFLYPNGGFEQMSFFDMDKLFLSSVDSGIKAVRLEERGGASAREEYIVSLYDYHVGTSAGGNRLSAPIASLSSGTDYSTDRNDPNYLDWVAKVQSDRARISSVYETADSYLLGSCLVVDKRTNRITPLDAQTSDHVVIPTQDNIYKGLAWNVSEADASWFDVRTLEYGVVHFDLSQAGAFQKTGFSANIPAGEATITGVRNSDGKQVVCIVNIETGHAVCSVNDSDRPITVLVPLN